MEMRAGTKRDDIVQQRLWMRHMAGWRQVTALIFALLIASFFMAGCTERGDDEEAGGKLQNQEIGEYALIVGDTIFELDASPEFGDEKESYLMEEFAEEFPFPASRVYRDEMLEIRVFTGTADHTEEDSGESLLDDEAERIYLIRAKEGETARGIGIGDSLSEVKEVYPEAVFFSGSVINQTGEQLENTRIYRFYKEDDETNNYIDFYMSRTAPEGAEKENAGKLWHVTMLEISDALDASREVQEEGILGDTQVHIEMLDNRNTRIFRENEDGSEEEIFLFSGSIEQADLDNDLLPELLCYGSQSNRKTLMVIDQIDGEIAAVDVNESLGSTFSDYAGQIANIQEQYRNCILAGFEQTGGQLRSELYDYHDGKFTYRNTLEDALQK